MMGHMKRETLEHVLAERQVKGKNGSFKIPDSHVATLLLGSDRDSLRVEVCELSLQELHLSAESKKGTRTYVEYDAVQAITFEPKEEADRRTGFV